MPRRLRVIVENQPHHVIQRGHSRGAVFFEDEDYVFYRNCVKTAAERYDCRVHAYCLMTNHVHLLITPPSQQALSRMMQMIGRLYVRRMNAAGSRSGALWEGRYKVSVVDSEAYLLTCMRYIELNPVRARIARRPGDYAWSSYAANAEGDADMLAEPHAVYDGLGPDRTARQDAYRALFEQAVSQDDLEIIRQSIQRNWALGGEAFREKIARKSGIETGPVARGGDRRSEKFRKQRGTRPLRRRAA